MLFLVKFFCAYFILTLLYQGYLSFFGYDTIDSITRMVAKNTEQLMQLFRVDFRMEENQPEQYIRLFYNQKYVARIIEGCNAISVIILFISFLVSFSGKLKPTLLFIFFGSVLIYILNVIRIAILCALLYYFPAKEAVLHRVFFPLFIYGVVFLIWVVWVNKFSLYAKSTTKP